MHVYERGHLRHVTGIGLGITLVGLRSPVTGTVTVAQAASYLVLRLWQERIIPGWIDWNVVWQRSILSQEAIDQGRYYTLFTCYLFQQDLLLLLFELLAIGFFFGMVERRAGAKLAALIAILGCLAGSACFLIVTNLSTRPDLAPWAASAIEFFRPGHAVHDASGRIWRCVPLWVLPGVAACLLAPGGSRFWVMLGLGAAGFIELSWVGPRTGQQRAWDGFALNAALGLLVGLMVLVVRRGAARVVRPSIRR